MFHYSLRVIVERNSNFELVPQKVDFGRYLQTVAHKSLKSIPVLILFAYEMMIGSTINNGENFQENAFELKKKKPGLNLTLG